MGCERSKTVRVQPVGPAQVSRDNTKVGEAKTGSTQTPDAKKKRSSKKGDLQHEDTKTEFKLDEHGNKVPGKKRRQRSAATKDLMGMGSCDTLDDTRSLGSDRGVSATSKQSADSGLGEDYAHVITEYSQEEKVRLVEDGFVERDDLDLGVTGVQLATRHSANDRSRLEEAQIMQSLRAEGLITKPTAQSSGGMCFEIVSASGDGVGPRPPPRLEKLERRRKKKKALTEEEIRNKLEMAERRRKKREQERLEKIRVMERTDALGALDNFAHYQRSKEETLVQRLDQASDNKEKQMRERLEKLERRKRHAEEVRKRKQLAKENGTYVDHTGEEGEATAAAMLTEMTPNAAPKERPSSSRSSSRASSRGSKRRE